MVTCSSMANRTKVIYLSEGNPSRDRSCYVAPVAIRAPAHIIETDQGTYIVQGNPVSEHSSLSPDESLVEIPSSGNDEGKFVGCLTRNDVDNPNPLSTTLRNSKRKPACPARKRPAFQVDPVQGEPRGDWQLSAYRE